MDIIFNRNERFTEKEVEFMTRILREEYDGKLAEHHVIHILHPIHHSSDDILPHFTYCIWDKYTDVRDMGFVRPLDLHGYVWTEQDGEFTLEFITHRV
jgi:hypothetical protein